MLLLPQQRITSFKPDSNQQPKDVSEYSSTVIHSTNFAIEGDMTYYYNLGVMSQIVAVLWSDYVWYTL